MLKELTTEVFVPLRRLNLCVTSFLEALLACYGVLRFVMENGAKGCEVIVSGKLRAQRVKSMKFKDEYMVSSGQPVKEYIDSAVRHVHLRQGVLGIKVKIMLDWDSTGKLGPKTPLLDNVVIHMPKDDVVALPPKEVEEYRPPLINFGCVENNNPSRWCCWT
ncbi:hypothetical protein L1987_45273 [Smallanthus sonchifolius]|uniref:Uncharacterized protein n=1 Tax=Smallanthus sonchifolius TaxID=185202 RepID=A0ACB9GRS8_9ASTR|nr:hypothetical protein L1987_45273 [Smallanthus sonchifolius]